MQRFLLLPMIMVFCIACLTAENTSQSSNKTSSPRFEKRASFTVMGVQAKDALDEATMDKIRREFAELKDAVPKPVGIAEYGITYFGRDFDPNKRTGYYYLVGKEVESASVVPQGLTVHQVPDAYYAIFEHRGPATAADQTMDYIFGEWIPKSGYSAAMQDILVKYDERFKIESPESVMEIWVPLIINKAN